MTPFAILRTLAGLSIREASEFLNAQEDTAKKWNRGARNAPPGVINELRGLIAKQELAASEALALIGDGQPEVIELGYPSDDYEAKALGWPCAAAWGAVAARIMAGSNVTIKLVPRGSTLGTAAADDVHQAI